MYEFWRSNKLLFLLGVFAITVVVVAIIVGVIVFLVTPSLPVARVPSDMSQNLELADRSQLGEVLLRIF